MYDVSEVRFYRSLALASLASSPEKYQHPIGVYYLMGTLKMSTSPRQTLVLVVIAMVIVVLQRTKMHPRYRLVR
jgi:hypothetical protein